MIRAFASESPELLGVSVTLAVCEDENSPPSLIYRVFDPGDGSDRTATFGPLEQHEPNIATRPTMRLGHYEARALLDALLRFYQGASDTHTVRADLLHERGRVDKLTDALIGISGQLAGPLPEDRLAVIERNPADRFLAGDRS